MAPISAVKISDTVLEVTKTSTIEIKTRHERAKMEQQLKEIEAQREYANIRFDEQAAEVQAILNEMNKQGVVLKEAEPVKIEEPVEVEKP
jgi:hypothetical protein